MRIGQVTHIYRPHIGGIENHTYRLKKFFDARGNRVTVYTTDLSFQGSDKQPQEDTIYCRNSFSLFRNPFSRELNDSLKNSAEDIYHLHNPWFFTSFFAAKALKGRPQVMSVHGAEIASKDFIVSMLSKLYNPLAQSALAGMDMLMVEGEVERVRLLENFKLPPEKVVVIPNGIEVDRYDRDEASISNFIEKNGLSQSSFKVLFVSRLVEEKNPRKLIAAITEHMQHEDVEAILIGSGPRQYIDELKKLANKKVHILGSVSNEDLIAAYHASNLFVFLGLLEGMPTVIAEAMLCRLPVLTTAVGAIPDVVTDGLNGMFIPVPIREDDLAERIKHFIRAADNAKIGEKNTRKARSRYDWNMLAGKIEVIYKQVLGVS